MESVFSMKKDEIVKMKETMMIQKKKMMRMKSLVSAAFSNITQVSEIEPTVSDDFEKKIVTEFLAKGCGCKSWNNKP